MHFVATLVLAHLLADFPLQTNRIAVLKQKYLGWLLLHIFIYVAANWMLLGMQIELWPLIVSLGTAHLTIDCLKFFGIFKAGVHGFLYDQCAHLLSMILIALFALPWYEAHASFRLPTYILYPSLVWAFGLACMVFWWVRTCAPSNVQRQHEQDNTLIMTKTFLLDLEQRAGFALLCIMLLAIVIAG